MDPEPSTPQSSLPAGASAKEGLSPKFLSRSEILLRRTLFLALLSFLLLLTTLFLAYQNMQLKKQIEALQTSPIPPISQITPTTTVDPTTNWKTYSGKEFSFKYPGEWFSGVSGDGTILINNILFDINQIAEPDQVIITLERVTDKKLIEAYTKNVDGTSKTDDGVIFDMIDLSSKSSEGAPQKQIFFAQTLNNGEVFRFGLSKIEYKTIFDQILSTFKFLDPQPTTNPQCGGIAGLACPTGYTCKLDGSYPDASGTCAKNTYTCPANGWANCMPILSEEGKKSCSSEAIAWYKTNCPNFQGIAQ